LNNYAYVSVREGSAALPADRQVTNKPAHARVRNHLSLLDRSEKTKIIFTTIVKVSAWISVFRRILSNASFNFHNILCTLWNRHSAHVDLHFVDISNARGTALMQGHPQADVPRTSCRKKWRVLVCTVHGCKL